MTTRPIFLFFLSIISPYANAQICQQRTPSEQIGSLDPKLLGEASGMAISRTYDDRIYHVNDSGDGPNFYVSKSDGSDFKTISIANFAPQDVEALALGSFGGKPNFLFIGDIGDNPEMRSGISVVVVEEPAKLATITTLTPAAIITLRYPDRPHNAEAMAVHPNGDLYILTKEMKTVTKQPMAAQLFRLARTEMSTNTKGPKTLEKIAEFDLPTLLADQDIWGRIVTGLDISPDGKRVLIMTYSLILELQMDLADKVKPSDRWILGTDYVRIATEKLPQQEATAYGADGQTIYYNSEADKATKAVPIFKTSCKAPAMKTAVKRQDGTSTLNK